MAAQMSDLPPTVSSEHPDYGRERYTLAQAAAYLCVSRSLVYREVEAGALGCRRNGRGRNARLMFSQADLDAWRASRRVERRAALAPLPSVPTLAPLPRPAHRRFS